MRIYDISVGITPDMPVWPGDPSVVLERVSSIDNGAEANISHFSAGVHVGTHIDAPAHFLQEGQTVEHLSIRTLLGRAYVIDLSEADRLTEGILQSAGIPPRTKRLLLKTRNSELWQDHSHPFDRDYIAVEPDGAEWLVQRGVRLIGVDYLSVAPYQDPVPTHRILLQAGVVIVEGLNLSDVRQGRYNLYCLPMKLVGAEGAPARAILTGL